MCMKNLAWGQTRRKMEKMRRVEPEQIDINFTDLLINILLKSGIAGTSHRT